MRPTQAFEHEPTLGPYCYLMRRGGWNRQSGRVSESGYMIVFRLPLGLGGAKLGLLEGLWIGTDSVAPLFPGFCDKCEVRMRRVWTCQVWPVGDSLWNNSIPEQPSWIVSVELRHNAMLQLASTCCAWWSNHWHWRLHSHHWRVCYPTDTINESYLKLNWRS